VAEALKDNQLLPEAVIVTLPVFFPMYRKQIS
jgi:hypothetical protein